MNQAQKRLLIDCYENQLDELKLDIREEFKKRMELLQNQMMNYVDKVINMRRERFTTKIEEKLIQIKKNTQQQSISIDQPNTVNQSVLNQSLLPNITNPHIKHSKINSTNQTIIINNIDNNKPQEKKLQKIQQNKPQTIPQQNEFQNNSSHKNQKQESQEIQQINSKLQNSALNQSNKYQQQQHSKFNNVKQIDSHPFQPMINQQISAFQFNSKSQLENSKLPPQKSNTQLQQVQQINKQQQNKPQLFNQQNKIMALQNQFDGISQVGIIKKIDQKDQQNRIQYQKQLVYEFVQKIKTKQHIWLRKMGTKTGYIYSLDLRPLKRFFKVTKNFFNQVIDEHTLTQLRQFLQFYRQYQKHIKSIIIVKQIMLNFCPKNQLYMRIFNYMKWTDLNRISLQRKKYYYDSLDKEQFERFLIQANKQSQHSEGMKIQVNIHFLYYDMIYALSKIDFNCMIEIRVGYLTLQTYNGLKKMNTQSSQKIVIKSKFTTMSYKDYIVHEKQIQLNIAVLQLMKDHYDSQLLDIISYPIDMDNVRLKSKRLRQMLLASFNNIQNEIMINHQQFDKELFKLYSFNQFNNNGFFQLRIVHFMNYSEFIDQFQSWQEVRDICYYNNSVYQFNHVQPVTRFTKLLTLKRLKKFPNLKSILIDINQLNQRKRTSNKKDIQIDIHQDTLIHIFQLIQQYKQIKFKFCDSKTQVRKFYLKQQHFDTYEKLNQFFTKYEDGKRIKIINQNNNNNDISQKQLMLNNNKQKKTLKIGLM